MLMFIRDILSFDRRKYVHDQAMCVVGSFVRYWKTLIGELYT